MLSIINTEKACRHAQGMLETEGQLPGGPMGASSASSASSSTSGISGNAGAASVTTATYAPPTLVSEAQTATACAAELTH